MVSIVGLTKAEALKALYDNAKGFLRSTPGPLSLEEAEKAFETGDDNCSRPGYFDYLNGRVMKVDLSGDQFNPALYDRDNGSGAAARAISRALLKYEASKRFDR